MDLPEFLSALRGLSESDIRDLARTLQARFVSPADEVEWWRANLAIEQVARSSRARSQAVTAAGHEAARAVVGAAQRARLALPDTDVTCVARAANKIACALRLGSDGATHLGTLLKGWSSAVVPTTKGIAAPTAA
ncbi:MAG TPA: hypothetical protein VG034_11180 [Acidimicrobiia bacterium]|jgi:hypothetical protein|nr:hypothetical protein [Acidimicrobiia bacterium]